MYFVICLMIYDHANYIFAFCTISIYATIIRLKEGLKSNVQEIELLFIR
jgi:hypothetical protein